MLRKLFLLVIGNFHFRIVQAQRPYRILIKGGHVIDAKNNINEKMDVAIQEGKIVRVAKNIDTALAVQVVDAAGMYVTPGSSICMPMFFMVLTLTVI
jgi:dihydroorotase